MRPHSRGRGGRRRSMARRQAGGAHCDVTAPRGTRAGWQRQGGWGPCRRLALAAAGSCLLPALLLCSVLLLSLPCILSWCTRNLPLAWGGHIASQGIAEARKGDSTAASRIRSMPAADVRHMRHQQRAVTRDWRRAAAGRRRRSARPRHRTLTAPRRSVTHLESALPKARREGRSRLAAAPTLATSACRLACAAACGRMDGHGVLVR